MCEEMICHGVEGDHHIRPLLAQEASSPGPEKAKGKTPLVGAQKIYSAVIPVHALGMRAQYSIVGAAGLATKPAGLFHRISNMDAAVSRLQHFCHCRGRAVMPVAGVGAQE